jgi:hypothetical protein
MAPTAVRIWRDGNVDGVDIEGVMAVAVASTSTSREQWREFCDTPHRSSTAIIPGNKKRTDKTL